MATLHFIQTIVDPIILPLETMRFIQILPDLLIQPLDLGLFIPIPAQMEILQMDTSGQVLEWNGTAWAPATDDNTTYTAGTGISKKMKQYKH